jgi:serine/threonine-protein kinase
MEAFLNKRLFGRYQITARIGAGSMGVVYRAHDELLRRDVAVKVISETVFDQESRLRLFSEAQAAAALNHPNIVTIYDLGEADGFPFIIMELLRGQTLLEYHPAAFEEIQKLACQICQALEHAHRHQIIHRDLKLANIMVVGNQVKLMDFGLARFTIDDNWDGVDMDSTLVGTPAYIAPEQFQGQAADERSDLYALGVILYELTTGQQPFKSNNLAELISQIINLPPEPPSHLNPAIPSNLEALILKLLAKHPKDRCQSAVEVLERLGAVYQSPTVRIMSPRPRHNLPNQLTSFIGRQGVLIDIQQALEQMHLVSLVGSGGVGKTRLALQTGTNLLYRFSGGVWLVELAPLADPEFISQTVAAALGVRDEPGKSLFSSLSNRLSERDTLLILVHLGTNS